LRGLLPAQNPFRRDLCNYLNLRDRDVLIVGMNNGELVNEKKSPQSHVNVSGGLVMLMCHLIEI